MEVLSANFDLFWSKPTLRAPPGASGTSETQRCRGDKAPAVGDLNTTRGMNYLFVPQWEVTEVEARDSVECEGAGRSRNRPMCRAQGCFGGGSLRNQFSSGVGAIWY